MFSKLPALRSARRTVSVRRVRRQAMPSRSKSTLETTEADSPRIKRKSSRTIRSADDMLKAAMSAQHVSNTTSVTGEASEATASGPLDESSGSSAHKSTELSKADRPQIRNGHSRKPGKSGDEERKAVMRAFDASRPPTRRSSPDLWSGNAAIRKDFFARETFRWRLKAVTEAAEAASMSEETFSVGHFIFLPLNGKRVRFHKIFLRDACQCEICIDQHSGQKSFETAAIDPTIFARITKVDEDGAVTLTWEPDLPGHHSSTYSRSWLESVAPQTTQPSTAVASTAHRNLKLWKYASEFAGDGLEFFDYAEYLRNPQIFNNAMKKLGSWGLIFIDNVPQDETAVERIAEAIGPLRNTFYGRTWDVKSKPQAENVAYTAHHLGLHMDLLYMKNPPGIQLLHCLKASSNGGESMFADSFAAAMSLYNFPFPRGPALFRDLCALPVTYGYNKNGNYYRDTKPTIELEKPHKIRNRSAPLDSLRIGPTPTIANVNWSPPFQVPFTLEYGQHTYEGSDDGENLKNYLRAARAFTGLLNRKKAQFSHKLKPGQCVIFNNRRIVHGRQQFATENEERWLKGAYLDTDDFASTLRRVEQETGQETEQATEQSNATADAIPVQEHQHDLDDDSTR